MNIAKYIGGRISDLTAAKKFRTAKVIRSEEKKIKRPRVDYNFPDLGIGVVCDTDEKIRTIFLKPNSPSESTLPGFKFSMTRDQVREFFGIPVKFGEQSTSPILGPSGAWDMFQRDGYRIHIEYTVDSDTISMITLMGDDVVT